MIMPETLSPMWKVSVRILGIRLSYICQKAQMERNAKPTSTVRLVLSFIRSLRSKVYINVLYLFFLEKSRPSCLKKEKTV